MLWLAGLVGVLVGLTLATLGGGGSILAVPILVYLLDQEPYAATTGSLLVVGMTALASAVVHARAGRVRVRQGVTFGLVSIPGAMVGALLSADLDGQLLLGAFSIVATAAAIAMVSGGWRTRQRGDALAAGADRQHSWWLLVATATGVGALTGLLGVGGGFLIVPALVVILAMPMSEAVGTSLVAITIASMAALIVRIGQPMRMDWPVVIVFAGAALVAAVFASRLSSRARPRRLTIAFAVLLLVVAAYTGTQSLLAVA